MSLVPVTPQQIKKAVAGLDGIIKDVLARTGVPGLAAAVVWKGEVVFAKGYGTRDLKTGQPVTVDTVFQLASVSKSLASTVAAGIVTRKKADWTDPIVKYLPSFKLSDPYVTANVTIQDMLSHRSGLPGAAGDLLEDLGFKQDYILNRLRLEPLTPFRTIYNYSNFGYTSGALAASNALGKEWADAADDILFGPLGMTRTTYRHSDFLKQSNRTAMHVRVDGKWVQKYSRNADQEAPAGGGNSSVLDLAQWLKLQLAGGVWKGKPLIDPAALQETHIPHSLSNIPNAPSARSGFYGLGTDVSVDAAGRVRISHSGAFFQGASTSYVMMPSADLGIVVLTNGMPIGVPESIGAYFFDLAEVGRFTFDWLDGYAGQFAILLANTSVLAGKNPPAHPKPAHPLSFYTGTYTAPFYGPIKIELRAGRLHLLIGPGFNNDYVFSHWDGELFSFEPSGENAVGITAATFNLDPGKSKAASLTLEYYNTTGLGTFTRV